MARVIAIAPGYDNLTVRQPGDEFDMPDGATAPWFKAAEGDFKGPVKNRKAKPEPGEVEAGDTIA